MGNDYKPKTFDEKLHADLDKRTKRRLDKYLKKDAESIKNFEKVLTTTEHRKAKDKDLWKNVAQNLKGLKVDSSSNNWFECIDDEFVGLIKKYGNTVLSEKHVRKSMQLIVLRTWSEKLPINLTEDPELKDLYITLQEVIAKVISYEVGKPCRIRHAGPWRLINENIYDDLNDPNVSCGCWIVERV